MLPRQSIDGGNTVQYSEWFETQGDHQGFRCAWQVEQPKAVIQISHGMGEHIGRYQDFAESLNAQGYSVFGADHRGHGKSCKPENYGDMGENGWLNTAADVTRLTEAIKQKHPELPVFLFTHSMGTMLAQQFLGSHGHLYKAVILSGSPGFVPSPLARVASWISSFEQWRLGASGHSPLLEKLVFADSNKAYAGPSANGFEWLSRDQVEVKKYIDDPACGFVLTAGSMAGMFAGNISTSSSDHVARIPKSLPLLLLSGSDDPVHDQQKNLQRMIEAYQACGLTPRQKIYPAGRHEMLNEENREQVWQDVITYFDGQLAVEFLN